MILLTMDTSYEFDAININDNEDKYEALQNNLPEFIDTATGYFDLPEGIEAFVDDEGAEKNLKPVLCFFFENKERCSMDIGYIRGKVVFCRIDEDGNFVGLTKEDRRAVKKSIRKMVTIPGPDGEPILYKSFI